MTTKINKEVLENRVSVLGKLKEVTVKDLTTKTDGTPMKIATILVETGEGEVHRGQMMAVQSYVDKETNERKENNNYKAIQTIQDEFVSLKDIAEGKAPEGVTQPTVVRMNGSLELNMYKGRDGLLKEQAQINARYVSRQDNYDENDFGAEFTIHTFLMTNGVPVLVDDEETGEVKFKAAVIDYRGQAHPFEFTADNEHGVADWFENEAERGTTITLQGKIYNKYIIKEIVREAGNAIGKPIVDTKRETDRRLLVEGGDPIENDDSIKFISAELMTSAIEKYEAAKVEALSRADQPATSNTTTTTTTKKGISSTGAKKSTINKDSLPF